MALKMKLKFTQRPTESLSPAGKFLISAMNAFPSNLGERQMHTSMHAIMTSAIISKFEFDENEADVLSSWMNVRCQYGVFSFISKEYYRLACLTGSSYVKVWEKATGIKPWRATLSHNSRQMTGVVRLKSEEFNTRVANGSCVLLYDGREPDETAQALKGCWVWFITSMTSEQLILCRYAKNQMYKAIRVGTPIQIMKVDRKKWAELNEATKKFISNELDKDKPLGKLDEVTEYLLSEFKYKGGKLEFELRYNDDIETYELYLSEDSGKPFKTGLGFNSKEEFEENKPAIEEFILKQK